MITNVTVNGEFPPSQNVSRPDTTHRGVCTGITPPTVPTCRCQCEHRKQANGNENSKSGQQELLTYSYSNDS